MSVDTCVWRCIIMYVHVYVHVHMYMSICACNVHVPACMSAYQ